ncbi:hypothetical protein D6777_01235 [Candidatus Woesearchaeota archaeon]|nr:MAG: hypothetical protein D6777_01235 [Candidatus Woesearchaeota archaeon]
MINGVITLDKSVLSYLELILAKQGLSGALCKISVNEDYIVTSFSYAPPEDIYSKVPKKIRGYTIVFDWPEEYKIMLEGN